MKINIINLKLDTTREHYLPKISITQNDLKSDRLCIEITQNYEPFDLQDAEPVLVCLKPSGKYTLNPLEIVDGKLEYTLEQQEVVEVGTVQFQVLLYGINGERYSTLVFDIKVENELVNTTMIESEIVALPLLSELIARLDEMKLEVESALLTVANKRDKDIPIDTLDLSLELLNKINEPNYDDSVINQRIDVVEVNLTNKRDKDTKITELDLDLNVQTKLNKEYDDTLISQKLLTLTDLVNLKRDISTKIVKEDLSLALIDEINSSSYDDTLIKQQVVSLNDLVALKRDKTTKISRLDLDTELLAQIDSSSYDDTEIKASISNKRDKSIQINELDLTLEVQNKLNKVETPYDDTLIKNQISDLGVSLDLKRDKLVKIKEVDLDEQTKIKLNTQVEPYDDRLIVAEILKKRDKSTAIAETDLSVEVRAKLNDKGIPVDGYDDTAIRNDITRIDSNIVDINSDLTATANRITMLSEDVTAMDAKIINKRDNATKIEEVDLSEIVKAKLNSPGNGGSGESAYELAVKNGYIGTEAEWLISLIGRKGDKGDRGYQGERGLQGIQGNPGPQGIPGIIQDQNPLSLLGEILIWIGTQAQYDALPTVDANVLYFVR